MKYAALIAAALLIALGGCGKKEEPPPAPAPQAAVDRCPDVVILRIESDGAGGWLTYMENLLREDGRQPVRTARSGNWGQPGEKFRYCE